MQDRCKTAPVSIRLALDLHAAAAAASVAAAAGIQQQEEEKWRTSAVGSSIEQTVPRGPVPCSGASGHRSSWHRSEDHRDAEPGPLRT